MAPKKSSRRRNVQPKMKSSPENCYFCKGKLTPDYKDFDTLSKFVTDRARILGKTRTGVCSKHQRRLSVAIKRARFLGLIPYTPGINN